VKEQEHSRRRFIQQEQLISVGIAVWGGGRMLELRAVATRLGHQILRSRCLSLWAVSGSCSVQISARKLSILFFRSPSTFLRHIRPVPHLCLTVVLFNRYSGYRVFPMGKSAGSWLWPPTTSIAEIKERVELYLYSPSRPSWPIIGWNLPLPLK